MSIGCMGIEEFSRLERLVNKSESNLTLKNVAKMNDPEPCKINFFVEAAS